jgi:toxin-antitoxin system PIN domain toxin
VTFLLDVNVLIALIDPLHVAHEVIHRWFEAEGRKSWATCPLTENGTIRIVSHGKYPNTPGSAAEVAEIISKLRRLSGHVFWPDDISLVASDLVDKALLMTSGQVTDSYLLALAVAHNGQLATLDRRLSVRAVKGGKESLHLIAAL